MSVAQYLKKYAEPETALARQLFLADSTAFHNVLVIPACDESMDFIERLANRSDSTNLLLIVVINQTDLNTNCEQNRRLYRQVIAKSKQQARNGNLHHVIFRRLSILLIDRF